MSNIRLFYPGSLSINLNSKLDKSQSHYVNKVMRVRTNQAFSLFNSDGYTWRNYYFHSPRAPLSRLLSFVRGEGSSEGSSLPVDPNNRKI